MLSAIILFFVFENEEMRIFFSIWIGMSYGIYSIIPLTVISDKANSKRNILMHLNKKGKEEYKKWISFRNFIKNYTLVEEKNMEDIILYEKYIPYAIALGINKNTDNTIYSIFNKNELNIVKQMMSHNMFNDINS